MKHLPMESEGNAVIMGLTPNEIKDGIEIMSWDWGYVKFKVYAEYIQMTSIYIKPEFREQHKGTEAMKWLEEQAKDKKYVLIKAYTDGKSDILGRFLTSLNYKSIGNFLWKKDLSI